VGQKVHPYGFRLGIIKRGARATRRRDFPELLKEDDLIRKYLKDQALARGHRDIHIERKPGKVTVTVHTGPGVVIASAARGGQAARRAGPAHRKEVGIKRREIKRPELDAQLVAELCSPSVDAAHLVPARP